MKRDIHILRYFTSLVSISNGKVIDVTKPVLRYCPLATHLYKEFDGSRNNDQWPVRQAIQEVIEAKIHTYGFFTNKRRFSSSDIAIPFGASEMLMFALQKEIIDAAVIVCDGAGTVITESPETVQGIGARMNTLIMTSPLRKTIARLKQWGCRVLSESAYIDQVRGVQKAIRHGYKVIAVTVSGQSAKSLKTLRRIEKDSGTRIISLVVCTTGVSAQDAVLIRDYADAVWSCASFEIRRLIGPAAKYQVSRQIPVFIMTENGAALLSAYAKDCACLNSLDAKKQYLISAEPGGQSIYLGNSHVFVKEATLPVHARREPSLKDPHTGVTRGILAKGIRH